jgi:hypothetical protein
MLIILALRRPRQEDYEFEVSLSYVANPYPPKIRRRKRGRRRKEGRKEGKKERREEEREERGREEGGREVKHQEK